jgi:hypothetical protein
MGTFKQGRSVLATLMIKGLLVALAILLCACTPSYTVDKTVDYARKAGVINQYEIDRLHHWALSPRSRVVVAGSTGEQIDVQRLTLLLETQFAPYFGHVASISNAVTYEVALSSALKQQGDFLIFVTINQPYADDEHREEYHEVNLLLTVVDVNSQKVVDKIKLSAKTPPWTTYHVGLDKLLAAPLVEVARQLSGSS